MSLGLDGSSSVAHPSEMQARGGHLMNYFQDGLILDTVKMRSWGLMRRHWGHWDYRIIGAEDVGGNGRLVWL